MLATGGELGPVADDRQTADGSIAARRERLSQQVTSTLANASSVLVVGGGLTGVELAAECAGSFNVAGSVTLAVGPTTPRRGSGILPGFENTRTAFGQRGETSAITYARRWLDKAGVRVLDRWAVPPPLEAGAAGGTYRPGDALPWRDGGDGERAMSWDEAGTRRDLSFDAVFDCRGLRPNNA